MSEFPLPSSLFQLMNCHVCNSILNTPTTLRCGHSVCSRHIPLDLPCCSSASAPSQPTAPNLPPGSSVNFIPAPLQPVAPVEQPAVPKVDITVNKIISLLSRAQLWIEEEARTSEWVPAQPVDKEDLTDDEGDEDEQERTITPSHSSARRERTASDASGDSHASLSGSRRPRKRRRRHISPAADNPEPDVPSAATSSSSSSAAATTAPTTTTTPSHEETDPDGDLLTHLREQSARQRTVRPDQPLWSSDSAPHTQHNRPSALERFEKEMQSELTCGMCFTLFYEPVTTTCQHTFCAQCLHRSLDHSPACPLCRHELPQYQEFRDKPWASNKVLLALLLQTYPATYAERGEAIAEEERNARLDTPIFVAQLSFPGSPTLLHFFEPRYRLMLRRCLESPLPHFGMILPPRAGAPDPTAEYGTMLEIRSVQMLPDGRSMVETWGVYRFRILERGTLDGYMVGRVERIDDDDTDDDSTQTPSNEELMESCTRFIEQLREGATPWVAQRIDHTLGATAPADPALFSFWVALVLPIDDHEKAKLLPMRSAGMRLRLVCWWINQLNDQWWFQSGCVIL